MKPSYISQTGLLSAFWIAMITMSGCGGSGGGSSSTGGGGSAQNFSGEINITGGKTISAISAGVQNIVVKDGDDNQFTLPNVFSPDSIDLPAPVVVIKAGSKFLDGHYTATTATYINPVNNHETSIALTTDHKIAQDFVMPVGGTIRLPIDRIGSYTFPNGLIVRVPAFMKRVEVVNLKFSAKANMSDFTASTKLTFTGSGTPTGGGHLVFEGTGSVTVSPGNQGFSPYTANGVTQGTDKEFPTAGISYNYSSN